MDGKSGQLATFILKVATLNPSNYKGFRLAGHFGHFFCPIYIKLNFSFSHYMVKKVGKVARDPQNVEISRVSAGHFCF